MKKIILFTFLASCFYNCFAEEYSPKYPYDIIHAKFGDDNFGSIRINRTTGKAWYLSENSWLEAIEPKKLKKGVYKVIMIEGKDNWRAIRINMINGITWRLINGTWNIINETR